MTNLGLPHDTWLLDVVSGILFLVLLVLALFISRLLFLLDRLWLWLRLLRTQRLLLPSRVVRQVGSLSLKFVEVSMSRYSVNMKMCLFRGIFRFIEKFTSISFCRHYSVEK